MLNEHFADLVQKSDILELVTEPFLALSVFRLKPGASRPITTNESNELNRIFNRRIAGRQDILLTETDLDGIVCIRFAVGAYRTEDKHIHHAYLLLLQEGKLAIDEWERQNVREVLPNWIIRSVAAAPVRPPPSLIRYSESFRPFCLKFE